jgi:hypothetical protein
VKKLRERLGQIGFERTRRALAALALSLLTLVFAFLAMNVPPQWGPAFWALAACYGAAFMGVTAEWFWGRWFATGLGSSGVLVAVSALVQVGWAPLLALFGAIHGLVVVMLAGPRIAARFEGQPAWRERHGMDEFGAARLGSTVTRASAALPSTILWALGPKLDGQGTFAIATLTAGALTLFGLVSIMRARTFGLVALAGAIVAMFVGGAAASPTFSFVLECPPSAVFCEASPYATWSYWLVAAGPALPVLLLGAALAPFAGPVLRFLRPSRPSS